MRRLVCTVSAVFLFVACADSPTALQDDLAGPQFGKATIVRDGPIEFTGHSVFNAFMPRTQEWYFQDLRCDATAKMSFLDGHAIFLETTDCGGRELGWTGTLTPAGALKLNMQEDQLADIEVHTGCTLTGTMPVYHGRFDGESLSAAGHFHGLCVDGAVWGHPEYGFPPFPEDPVPVNVYFGFDLTVVP